MLGLPFGLGPSAHVGIAFRVGPQCPRPDLAEERVGIGALGVGLVHDHPSSGVNHRNGGLAIAGVGGSAFDDPVVHTRVKPQLGDEHVRVSPRGESHVHQPGDRARVWVVASNAEDGTHWAVHTAS